MPFYQSVERNLMKKIPGAWKQIGVPWNRWTDISGRFWSSWVCHYITDSCGKLHRSIICHISEFLGERAIQRATGHVEHHECMEQLLGSAPVMFCTKLSCSQFHFLRLTGQQLVQAPCRHDLPQKMCWLWPSIHFTGVPSHGSGTAYPKAWSWQLKLHACLQTKPYTSIPDTHSENEQGLKHLIYTKCAHNFWYQIHSGG
jgi:hypothetical protein